MRKRVFTQEEIEKVIYNYTVLNMGQKRAGKEFKMNDRMVRRLLEENNIPIKSIQETNISRYKINEKFFDIENSDMAYLLGLISSDGCIASNENCIYIELQEADGELLEEINRRLENERPIKYYQTSSGYKNAKLYFFSKHIKDRLKYYNIVPNKTYSADFNFPALLNKKYWIDYIRGYFDGDGCVKRTSHSITFQIDGLKKEIFEVIQSYLLEFGIETTLTYNIKNSGLKLWRLYCYGDNAQKIFQLMYYDKNQLRLNRKYEKYLLLKK